MKRTDIIIYALLAVSVVLLLYTSVLVVQKASIGSRVHIAANFESGSVQEVKLIDVKKIKSPSGARTWQLTYTVIPQDDPVNPTDSSSMPSNRWFYFRMTGIKNRHLRLLFQHTDPVRPVYSYDGSNFARFTAEASAYRQVSTRFTSDTVYIAYFHPYTFSRLQAKIGQWTSNGSRISMDTIGWSAQRRPVQMFTVTDPSVPDDQKRRVYIHARIHSGETPAAWFAEYLIDTLLANTEEAASWRRSTVFYIVPCANPDGVVNGLSRSNIQGIDLEMNYQAPDSLTAPEVYAIKKTVKRLTIERPLDIVLNLHSQTTPRTSFWIHTAVSTSLSFFQQQMQFAHVHTEQNPFFSQDDLLFSDLSAHCIEGWLWEQYQDKTLALTFETPYTYYRNNPYGEWVTIDNLNLLGRHFLRAVSKYLSAPASANTFPKGVQSLMAAYPSHIMDYQNGYIIFHDHARMRYAELQEMFAQTYPKGAMTAPPERNHDPGRIRNEAFFKKMYGSTPQEVQQHLTNIEWCPKTVGQTLMVTTINNVDKQLMKVSAQLDSHPEWASYLVSAGTYHWRTISGSDRLSPHSYGIAIDLNTACSNYWQWDYKTTDEQAPVAYRNRIPQGIVDIFEQHGFIWGGKWYHYDTMHFEYRPELLIDE